MIGKEIYLYLYACMYKTLYNMYTVGKQWFGTRKIHIQVKLVTLFITTLYLTFRRQNMLPISYVFNEYCNNTSVQIRFNILNMFNTHDYEK